MSDAEARNAGDDVAQASTTDPDPDAKRLLNSPIPHAEDDHRDWLDRRFENTEKEPCSCQTWEVMSSSVAGEHDTPDDDLKGVSPLWLAVMRLVLTDAPRNLARGSFCNSTEVGHSHTM